MLHLDNKVNHQHYRVLILPGVKCISPECLRTVERFRRAGGRVIFTTALPETSTRFEVPATQVAARVQEMLTARKNPALFLPEPDTESLRKALEADFIPDVTVSGAPGLRTSTGYAAAAISTISPISAPKRPKPGSCCATP